eukprot:CFRG5779T1
MIAAWLLKPQFPQTLSYYFMKPPLRCLPKTPFGGREHMGISVVARQIHAQSRGLVRHTRHANTYIVVSLPQRKFMSSGNIPINRSKHETGNEIVAVDYKALLEKVRKNPSLDAYHEAIAAFSNRPGKFSKGAALFIKNCLSAMDETKITPNRKTYNALLDVFPRRRWITRTLFDVMMPKYTPEVKVGLDVLQRMEDDGCRPDTTTYDIVEGVYGKSSVCLKKLENIFYWFTFYGITEESRTGKYPDRYLRTHEALARLGGAGCDIVDHFKIVGNDAPDDEELFIRDDTPSKETERTVHSFIASVTSKQHEERLHRIEAMCVHGKKRSPDVSVGSDGYESASPASSVAHILVEGPHLHWFDRHQAPYYTFALSVETIASSSDGHSAGVDAGSRVTVDGVESKRGGGEIYEIVCVAMVYPDSIENLGVWAESIAKRHDFLSNARIMYNVGSKIKVDNDGHEDSSSGDAKDSVAESIRKMRLRKEKKEHGNVS